MADRVPLYFDDSADQVARMVSGTDTVPAGYLDSTLLKNNAAGVPYTPENGIESTDTQAALAELSGRYAGGRRTAYFPYRIRRTWERVQPIHRIGQWVAGDAGSAALTAVVDTHGSAGHLYPFMTFAAVDSNGNPHRDHDRLTTSGGPDLATDSSHTLSTAAGGTDTFKFVTAATNWGTGGGGLNFEPGDTVYAVGWGSSAGDGRWEVAPSIADGGPNVDPLLLEMHVIDPGNAMTTYAAAGATAEVRGTQSNSSGFNGYEEGLFLLANTLETEERIRFEASGFLENPASGGGSNAFVEFCIEPNPGDNMDSPGSDQYAGANRMRMLSGELGATWSGTKGFTWRCDLALGNDAEGVEYIYEWWMAVEDVVSIGGRGHVTAGHNFKETDTYLSTRFRVDLDPVGRLDTYDATNQDQGLRLEVHKFDAGTVR